MIHVDRRELFSKALAHAVGAVGIDPAGIGDKADDAFIADAIGRPAIGADVGVIQRILVDSLRPCRIRFGNPIVQLFIVIVLVVIVGIVLTNGVWRVADDDADVLPVQFRKSSVVLTECRAEDVALPIVGKRIGPNHHFVRLVHLIRAELMEDPLDIH